MNLEIAVIKYTRGELESCQLPVIALQALEDGYSSESLTILAGESEPVGAEVNPLFESAMNQLGIKLPIQANQSEEERSQPLSAYDPKFTKMVHEVLQKNGDALVFQRFAYTAGANAGWYLIKSVEQWQELLDSGKTKTAFTLILDPIFSLRGVATPQLKDEALALFDRLGDLMMAVLPSEDTYISLQSTEWTTNGWKTQDAERAWVKAKNKVVQFFENYQESQVGIGRNLFVWDEDIKEITAYIPDEDGVVRSGAY